MNNMAKMYSKIKKKYNHPNDNLYSHRFYSDLFSGYSYSLCSDEIAKRDFYKIITDDDEIVNLFSNGSRYDFSYEFGQTIDRVLYSIATYGKAYIFIRPEYIEKIDENGECYKKISALHIGEVKGIPKKNSFYYINFSKISEFDIGEGILVPLDLKELGYKRNYFVKLVKKLGKYDTTAMSLDLITNEPAYDFDVHINKNRKRFLRQVREIGWLFGTDGLSESYILYKEILMKRFKLRILQYVLEKTNKALANSNITDHELKIVATTGGIDYEDSWTRFQDGEITVSELSNIVWKGTKV